MSLNHVLENPSHQQAHHRLITNRDNHHLVDHVPDINQLIELCVHGSFPETFDGVEDLCASVHVERGVIDHDQCVGDSVDALVWEWQDSYSS